VSLLIAESLVRISWIPNIIGSYKSSSPSRTNFSCLHLFHAPMPQNRLLRLLCRAFNPVAQHESILPCHSLSKMSRHAASPARLAQKPATALPFCIVHYYTCLDISHFRDDIPSFHLDIKNI
jgi:hypothetical protein